MTEVPKQNLVSKVNTVLATRITMLVGSIWAFYAFVIFGLTPVLWPEYETQILYWSNFLQLVFLPAITVGTAIMNRDSEARAAEDHQTIRREFDLLQEAHDMLNKSLKEIAVGMRELLVRSERDRTGAMRAMAGEAGAPKTKTAEG
jgi:hypothetical protein